MTGSTHVVESKVCHGSISKTFRVKSTKRYICSHKCFRFCIILSFHPSFQKDTLKKRCWRRRSKKKSKFCWTLSILINKTLVWTSKPKFGWTDKKRKTIDTSEWWSWRSGSIDSESTSARVVAEPLMTDVVRCVSNHKLYEMAQAYNKMNGRVNNLLKTATKWATDNERAICISQVVSQTYFFCVTTCCIWI